MGSITSADIVRFKNALARDGFAEEFVWSESVGLPANPYVFATEAIYVICNSGMKWAVARGIFDRIIPILERGGSSFEGFRHSGKSAAIDRIWRERSTLYEEFLSADDKLAFCRSIPWIGDITCYHLAKNFGVDVAKPDVHLQRIADREGIDVQSLCKRLAEQTGFRVATVDVLLWRASATGLLDSKTGEIRVAEFTP